MPEPGYSSISSSSSASSGGYPGASGGGSGSSSSSSSSNSSYVDTSSLAGIERASNNTPIDRITQSPSIADRLTDADSNSNGTDDNEVSAINVGRASAAGRESLVTTQTNRAYDIGANTPQTDYSGTIHRAAGGRHETYANFTYSDQGGRFALPGQTISYNAETVDGIRAEVAHYPSTDNPTGMSNQTVVKSDFNGSIVDVVGSNQITAAALSEPFGGSDPAKTVFDASGNVVSQGPLGKDRTLGSIIAGEDPYAHTRAFADGARAQGAEAIRVPANDGFVNLNIIPENTRSMSGQYNYVNHTNFDAAGNATRTVFSPSVQLPPDGATPGYFSSDASTFPGKVNADTAAHSRAGGARYGAAGAGFMSTANALSDGELTLRETGDIARDSALGSAAAVGSDALGNRIGMVKGGAVVDGVVAVGTSVWSNADAVENGDMSAGDATADVVVDTGVAVAAGLTGMAAGAAVGSVIPIAGTAVGAGVGFVVGMGGAWLATKSLEDFTGAGDFAREKLGNFLEGNFEKPLDAVWDGVADAKDATVDFVSDSYSATKNALSDAGSAVKGFVGGLFGR